MESHPAKDVGSAILGTSIPFFRIPKRQECLVLKQVITQVFAIPLVSCRIVCPETFPAISFARLPNGPGPAQMPQRRSNLDCETHF